ncbi:hypothetical protein ACMFMF_002017 [Clarireedia jacksonii]
MRYKLPAVALEDIELNVKDIMCSDSTIVIDFPSASLLANAEREWEGLSEFLVISSHAGCNDEGARAPYLVSSVLFNSGSNTAVLSVQRISWKDAYGTMEIKFGMGQYAIGSVRTHGMKKRTITSTSVSSSITVSFPPPALPTPTSDKSDHDIGYVAPSDFSFTITQSNGNRKETITIKCGNCSIAGDISITHGAVSMGTFNTSVGEAVNFLKEGYFYAEANGFNAHIEIDTSISGAIDKSFSYPLVTLALPGFAIPGIAAIGPLLVPTIIGEIVLSESMDFTYGFEFNSPDKSYVNMSIGNLSDSTSNGFSDSSINTIPFTSTSPLASLTLSLGLQSQILLGVDILEDSGSINAGAFLNLPKLEVAFNQVSDVDSDCKPINKSLTSELKSEVYQNLINIVPAANIAIGLQAGIQARLAAYTEAVETAATMAQTGLTLPTACLSFDGSKKAFASPTPTSTSKPTSSSGGGSSGGGSSGEGSSGQGKSKSAGVHRGPPSGVDAVFWTGGMLLSVLFVALTF